MTARIAIHCLALILSPAIPGAAQSPDDPPTSQSPTVATPTIRDGGHYWSEASRASMNATIAGIFRRYRCRVIVESYPKQPNDWADGADLDNQEALSSALTRVCNKRAEEARVQDPMGTYVVIIGGPGRCTWAVGLNKLSPEDREKVSEGIRERVQSDGNSLSRGIHDILTLISEACQGRVAPPIGPMVTSFKDTVKAGGLSNSDLEAVLGARGGIPYDDLTDFAKDQMKDGRKGSDLKDDLLTFIKLYEEKKKDGAG